MTEEHVLHRTLPLVPSHNTIPLTLEVHMLHCRLHFVLEIAYLNRDGLVQVQGKGAGEGAFM